MDPADRLLINLFVNAIFGAICAAIAASKGRSAVGWFFVGLVTTCIGLIIILVMSNLKEEQARWNHAQNERRRLREQLKQERIKNEALRQHVNRRLDVHDDALGLNTRGLPPGETEEMARLEYGSSPDPVDAADRPVRDAPATGGSPGESQFPDPGTFKTRLWALQIGRRQSQNLLLERIRELYHSGRIDERNLVWTEGMGEWKPIIEVPGLLEELV